MKEKNLFLSLIAIIFLMSALLYANIGYADENIVTKNMGYNNLTKNFSVEFKQDSNNFNKDIEIINSQKIILKKISLTDVGEEKKIVVPIVNYSQDLDAKIQINTSNSNPEYFKITAYPEKLVLNKNLDESLVEITVELIKKPLYSDESAEITIDIIAEPNI